MLESIAIGAVVMGGYYIYYTKFGGKARAEKTMRKTFGLAEGEQYLTIIPCYYALERKLGKEIALGAIGMKTSAMNLSIVITDQNRLIFANQQNGEKPMGFAPHQVRLFHSERPRASKRLVSQTGKLEKTETIVIETPAGANHYEMPESGIQAIRDWLAQDEDEQHAPQ